MSLISLRSVFAGYRKKQILRGVTLSASRGEVIALIGSNGTGKSTLLRVIAGLVHASSGDVLYEGESISRLPTDRRVRLGISFMLQGKNVFPSLTVKENLVLSSTGSDGMPFHEALECALMELPSLSGFLETKAGLLSGGQRQSLALGMMLVQQPSLLLLDEPSAGLAPDLARAMLMKIRDLSDNTNMGIIVVEQRVKEVLQIADRAIVMVSGCIAAETNSPSEWLNEGALENYFLGNRDNKEAK